MQLAQPHTEVSPGDVSACLKERRHLTNIPERQLFQKTLAFFFAVKKQGCTGPPLSPEVNTESDAPVVHGDGVWKAQIHKARRGHSPKQKCDGNILFKHAADGTPYLR